jgi:hypothetical protein
MNGTVNTATAEHPFIGSIDDRIDFNLSDISNDYG